MNRRTFFEMAAAALALLPSAGDVVLSIANSVFGSNRKIWKGDSPPPVQTVKINGEPTGGVFTLTFCGETTAALAYNASPAEINAALNKLG